jgi:hypothetical protein
MANRVKPLFYSVLFNKCHHRTNLIALILYLNDNGLLKKIKFWVLRVPPIQISSQNGKMQVLFNKFHRRINLMALLVTILGPRNKKRTQNFKIWHTKGTPHNKFRLRRVKTCVLLRKFPPRTNLTALLVTIEESRNKKRNPKFRNLTY